MLRLFSPILFFLVVSNVVYVEAAGGRADPSPTVRADDERGHEEETSENEADARKTREREAKEREAKEQEAKEREAPDEVPAAAPSHDEGGGAAGVPEVKPLSIPTYRSVVRAKAPVSPDPTSDDVTVRGEKLRNSARSSTLETLSQESAGVYVTGRGAIHGVASGGTGGIYIRGLGGSPNSQVLVVEDGVPDYMGIFGHPIPDAYVPFLIGDALVIKGGDSVLYGSNAMGGVVVLRNRWRKKEGFELQNDAAYGSYETIRETASVLGRVGDLDIAAAFHALSTDGHRDRTGGNMIVGHLAARYELTPNLRLGAKNKVVHLTGADPGPVSHPHVDHWFDVWRNNSSARLEWKRSMLRVKVTPFFNLGVHRLYDGFLSHDYVAGGIAEAKLEPHRTVEVLCGLSGQHIDGRVENRITGESPDVSGLTDLSAYAQVTYRPIKALSAVAGGRALYSLTYGMIFLYKGGVRWNVFRGLYARTRIAKNFRQPTIRELYLPFPTSNPDLKPEHALNWDFGLEYVANRFKVSATGYRTQADDMIRYFGAWPTAEVVNIDHIVIWGVEGRAELRNLGPVSMHVTGDWKHVGRYTRQNPEAKLDFTVEAKHAFGRHFVGATLTGEWIHGLYMSNYGRDPIDDVFAMNLAVRYRYTSKKRGFTLEPYLFLRNFLDRRYAFVEGYPMPGFNVLAGLKLGI